ncbi:MarR family transcriptional regulator [Sphingosinicella sp.]|jgi:DNA-binding MarR family transcriptional regulator|uniref:MarR family winged helix-turn-helix transcriptional regulator n=1 Tax=Sphingosinicella sp. TaxID=1917971 RepID=UPI002626CA25|nr:MarR family transcriptional regulator [Sphingosinicella sp.]
MTEQVPSAISASGEFDIEQWPFYWLTRFTGRYLHEMEITLKTLGLDIPRWRVLMSLRGDKVLSVSEIADNAIVKLPTMTRIVQRMQTDGLVRCRQSASDRRVTEVELTDAGKRAGQQAWAVADSLYTRTFGKIPADDVMRLNRTLRTLNRNLDD